MSFEPDGRSLPEVHASVGMPSKGASWLRRMFAFAGPAYLVSVGYMDPGNWATDLAGGSRFGYQLLWVLLMSNIMAVLLQTLAARLGVVTGRDLAQACRDWYPPALAVPLWLLCEIAIVACDLAEVLGAAIGLKLLFGVPLLWGVMVTALDVLLLLALSRFGMRRLEALIITFVLTIGLCFAVEMVLSRPDLAGIVSGLLPRDAGGSLTLFARSASGGVALLGLDTQALYVATGILGATVMPHNLYLHSALVQSRAVVDSVEGKREACRMNLVDTIVALNAAFFVNAGILVLAAATFHRAGLQEVASIEEAHRLLAPLLGTSLASTLFALALLCSGQSSTITGTLAGQIVMEGFLRIRLRPWLRRMISRGLAIVPAVFVIVTQGERGIDGLLVLSQVVLSLQLSFAVVPLVAFTSDRRRMGAFVNPPWVVAVAVLVTAIIATLNAKLVIDTVSSWLAGSGPQVWIARLVVVPLAAALGALLLYVLLAPWLQRRWPRLAPAGGDFRVPTAAGSRIAIPALPAIRPGGSSPYRRIAVALERGSADESVLRWLHELRHEPGASLVLIHVVESAASRFLGEQTADAESRGDQAALEEHARALRAGGLAVEVRLGHGDPAGEIARIAQEFGAELLVTGSHGHTGLRDVVYGSTVSGVRHRVSCPVLTVPSR